MMMPAAASLNCTAAWLLMFWLLSTLKTDERLEEENVKLLPGQEFNQTQIQSE